MATEKRVTRVWIEAHCVVCEVCESACPDVFEVRDDRCVVRPEAGAAGYLAARSVDILTAAAECPVDAIRLQTTKTISPIDEPKPDGPTIPRRSIIGATGWAALGSGVVLSALAAGRFMFPNVLDEPDPTVHAGQLSTYAHLPVNTVIETFSDQHIWIVRLEDRIVAVGSVCTHLGCPTRFNAEARTFQCPCHGSSFGIDGTNIDGPAPRALDRFKIRNENGAVIIDRSKTFRKERNEWNDPRSFINA